MSRAKQARMLRGIYLNVDCVRSISKVVVNRFGENPLLSLPTIFSREHLRSDGSD